MRSKSGELGWPQGFRQGVDGKVKWVNICTCRKCGRTEEVPHKSMAVSRRTGNEVEVQLIKLGWTKIAPGKGVCPACSQSKPSQEEVMPPKPVSIPQLSVVEKPITVRSPAAQAKIPELYLTLGEVYDVQLKCYKDGYSDAKIAAELEMAEEFVRQRREMDFGPLVAKTDHLDKVMEALTKLERQRIDANLPIGDLLSRVGYLNAAIDDLRMAVEKARDAKKGIC